MNLSKKLLSISFLVFMLPLFGVEYQFPAYTYKGFVPFLQAGLTGKITTKWLGAHLFMMSGINKTSGHNSIKMYAGLYASAINSIAYGFGLQAKTKLIDAQIESMSFMQSPSIAGLGSIALNLPIKQLPFKTAVGIDFVTLNYKKFHANAFIKATINNHLDVRLGIKNNGSPYAGLSIF